VGEPSKPGRTESDLTQLLAEILKRQQPDKTIRRESRVAARLVPDLMLQGPEGVHIVEVKKNYPQTLGRLLDLRDQLIQYREAASELHPRVDVRMTLAIPGFLTPEKVDALHLENIEVWDKDWIIQAGHAVGLTKEVREFFDAGETFEARPPRQSQADILRDRLQQLKPGRTDWSAYQKFCRETFEYLFCPELSSPIEESANESGINRRDFIMPNYSSSGFWLFLRSHYQADYLVADAKNLKGLVSKANVLQVCNYMTRHGTGLFGIIITRNGADRTAEFTRREQWVLHNKMLVVLNDEDILQMLKNRGSNEEPSSVIRQRIEDFRLAL
jgi:hypothetical protein